MVSKESRQVRSRETQEGKRKKTRNRAVNNLPAFYATTSKLSPYRESPISLLEKVPNMLSTLHFPPRQKPKSIPPDIF